MAYVIHVSESGIAQVIAGPVTRDLRRRANRVERAAQRMVGVDTGALRRSIHTTFIPGSSPTFTIGSPLGYAYMHHEGTRPHIIRPHLRRSLRFMVRGRVVYATVVFHPGTRHNRYLTIPLARYARG
jgi:hypothetical protein